MEKRPNGPAFLVPWEKFPSLPEGFGFTIRPGGPAIVPRAAVGVVVIDELREEGEALRLEPGVESGSVVEEPVPDRDVVGVGALDEFRVLCVRLGVAGRTCSRASGGSR